MTLGGSTGPLSDLLVVEVTGIGPVPLAGQLLADHGARVIVVDRKGGKPDQLDPNNRGKEFIPVDLKSEQGRQVFLRLVAKADVLLEGFRPGVMERLGLGSEPCFEINAGLIYGRMTGWGQSGPLKDMAGHDLNYLGLSGALAAMGEVGRPPMPPLNLIADYGGGTMFLLFGVLMALHQKNQTGKGQVVDAAMLDGVIAMMGLVHGQRASGIWRDKRQSNWLDGAAPFYRCYVCQDDRYVAVACIEPQFFAQFVDMLELPQRYKSMQMDPKNWADMTRGIETKLATRSRDQWAEFFYGSDACVTPVLAMEESGHHLHNVERVNHVNFDLHGYKPSKALPDNVWQSGIAPRIGDQQPRLKEISADDNTHQDILRMLGYDDQQIGALTKDRIVG